MAIEVGDKLPSAGVLVRTAEGKIERRDLSQLPGRTALFAVPGAFTATCTNAHLPSLVRTAAALRGKGVDRVACLSVNDPFVMEAWGQAGGADEAGIEMLADADGSFTRALDLAFDAPEVGLNGRSQRYSMLVEDGVVKSLNIEPSPGALVVSSGEAMLASL